MQRPISCSQISPTSPHRYSDVFASSHQAFAMLEQSVESNRRNRCAWLRKFIFAFLIINSESVSFLHPPRSDFICLCQFQFKVKRKEGSSYQNLKTENFGINSATYCNLIISRHMYYDVYLYGFPCLVLYTFTIRWVYDLIGIGTYCVTKRCGTAWVATYFVKSR